jgi:hypothetical protein
MGWHECDSLHLTGVDGRLVYNPSGTVALETRRRPKCRREFGCIRSPIRTFSHSCDKEYSSNCQLASYVQHLMSDDDAFFEYQAKITNAGHAENEGEPVHCMIKMKSVDEHGKRRPNVGLEQQAGDDVLFVINPGPNRKISHSSIWSVSEEAFQKAGTASDQHRVGDCEIFFYRD